MSFFSTMADELGARRRRLRASLGDRGQGIAEFLVMAGLLLGSLGLLLEPWMPRAAPWGFALPFVYAIGFVLLERRRQRGIAAGADVVTSSSRNDWAVFLWGFGCALAGAAAFVLAWNARPAPPPAPGADDWHPPASAVPTEITPDH